jgi:Ca2+-transporting ATPase
MVSEPPPSLGLPEAPHALSIDQALRLLQSRPAGLTPAEVSERLDAFGPNALPKAQPAGLARVFLRQFLSALIYVLLIAAVISLLLEDWTDAGFIFAVLLVNAIIGTAQEYSAERAAHALANVLNESVRVEREGEAYEIGVAELVPGDVVLLESGVKVPADLRLLVAHDLRVDESLLTGESLPVDKDATQGLDVETPLAERTTMAFAGTLVSHGRASGVVTATGLATELGRIAGDVLGRPPARAPLLIRMERFTYAVAMLVGLATLLMAAVSLMRGAPLAEVFFLAVALAVSAIPEGLPVALTVALAIGMQRMARRNVIVRKLVAVEALGSCTTIASDKTGTLTLNQLTVERVLLPGGGLWDMGGDSPFPLELEEGADPAPARNLLGRLSTAAVLTNEGFLGRDRAGEWVRHGDPVDVALLVMAHKLGITRPEALVEHPEVHSIPFESENRFSASLNRFGEHARALVKGAAETVLPMCDTMATPEQDVPLNAETMATAAEGLAGQGFRVLAVAEGPLALAPAEVFSAEHLKALTLLGLVVMIDPLRPEAWAAVERCERAGIGVRMVTGDHPVTALTIARELGLAQSEAQVVTGQAIREAEAGGPQVLDSLSREARVFARVEPLQKLDIVQSLQRNGHFVAVTGDGANDAPALRAAHVGVAMGKRGTDVARESADLIITDDNFASIVAGIEEGRVAYANVRKVIFLLISTGAAEVVLFALALLAALPLPLGAVQLLWLNLVTNGIQDVALAFEPAEGGELQCPPRPPRERIFDPLMVERVAVSAAVIGGLAFAVYGWLLAAGYAVEEARNLTLLLMVLFENVQVFNSRSETRSAFRHNPWRNRLLLLGTLVAQLVHIGALYTPGLREVLGVAPVSLQAWSVLLGVALALLLVMEVQKLVRSKV